MSNRPDVLMEIPQVDINFPASGEINTAEFYAAVDDFLSQTAGKVVNEWIRQIKSGFGSLISSWAPLADKTVKNKEGSNPMAPLYDTGALVDRMQSWEIKTETVNNLDGSTTIEAFVDMGAIEKKTGEGSLISEDMFFGNDEAGANGKVNIPARPLLMTDDQLADTKLEYNTWFTGLANQDIKLGAFRGEDFNPQQTPHNIDPSDFDMYWSRVSKWT